MIESCMVPIWKSDHNLTSLLRNLEYNKQKAEYENKSILVSSAVFLKTYIPEPKEWPKIQMNWCGVKLYWCQEKKVPERRSILRPS